jgi:succinyl-diaminopimelate desuccinylase
MSTMKNLLAELVAMPTVTIDAAANEKALDFIQDFLEERGMFCKRFEIEGYGALVATTQPTKTPRIMLVGHTDVVPGPLSQFTMREQDGKIIGRGVWDMKSAIAGYMNAVDQLQDNLSDYDFGIMLTTDEETRDLSVKPILDQGYFPTDAAVLMDGARDWQLEKLAKGALYLNLSIQGKTGHGSRVWLVDSTSIRMVKMLGEIEKLFPEPGPDTNTLNISFLDAGRANDAYNQIPATARAGLDIRSINKDERARLQREIVAICEKYGAECELYADFPPLEHDLDNPHMKAFAASIEKATGVKNEGVTSYGASDAGHFVARGVPCIVTWPTGGGHHSDDEWIDPKALEDIPKVIVDYLDKMAKQTTAVIVEQTVTSR